VADRKQRLAVLGSPIAHSKSPALHRAAYDRLGLDWEYSSAEVDGSTLLAFMDSLDASWLGLSLTMPLKQHVIPLLDEAEELVTFTGAANTVLFDAGRRRGFNTDVGGIVRALGDAGFDRMRRGALIGGGATAASALVAMSELGAKDVHVLLRRPEASAFLVELGDRLGVRVVAAPLAELGSLGDVDLVVSTVPGRSELGTAASADLMRRALLFDVAYDPWPTMLAAQWLESGGTVVDGLGMLLHQALLQVRVFVAGDPATPLPDEAAVLAAMRDSL
jgi:shikimate dehydrogenase